MHSRSVGLESSAAQLQELIRQRGDYAHVHVQARAGHLLIKTRDAQGMEDIVARATPLGGGAYTLAFRTHAGRWEPMPVSGTMGQIVEDVIGLLGPYLDRQNLS